VSLDDEERKCHEWIALLGKGREDADGIQDYCAYLGDALARHNITLRLWRLEWQKIGWRQALEKLRQESKFWKGRWVLVQYTALAFSTRGFPWRALSVTRILRKNGARAAVVFHDPTRQSGSRFRDWIRGSVQDWVIRRLYRMADFGIFLDPLGTLPWLPKRHRNKAVSIPIGANLPELLDATIHNPNEKSADPQVAVYCLSVDAVASEELEDLFLAAENACKEGVKFRLIFLGRGTEEARRSILAKFERLPVKVSVMGLLAPERVAEVLGGVDAMLCVRGKLYPRRGSAIAGIACGLPILAYGGAAEGTPLNEAGVLLAPYRDAAALGQELARVLRDPALARELRCRSARAYQQYFSWRVIADAYVKALGGTNG